MKSERLLDIIGNIDDRYIEEAYSYIPSRKPLRKYLTQAALFMFAVMLVPLTTIRGCGSAGNDGYEKDNFTEQSYMYDILYSGGGGRILSDTEYETELKDTDDISLAGDTSMPYELPVYKNLAYVSAAGESSFFTEEELTDILNDTFAVLGSESVSPSVETDNDGEKILSVSGNNGYFDITVYGNGDTDIMFEYPDDSYAHITDYERKTAYYAEKYSELLGYDGFVTDIDISYTITGEEYAVCHAYGKGEDCAQTLLNKYFNSARFLYDENGALYGIYTEDVLESSEMKATLPVKSYNTAKEELLSGKYISDVYEGTVCGGSLTEDDIAGWEIVYSDGEICRYFVPYYAFYVKTEDYTDYADGKEYCGIFYVPAVDFVE